MDPTRHIPRISHRPVAGRRAATGRAARRLTALATVLVALLALAAPAQSATTNITMVGRGWGHGIGMSQWGAFGYAKNGATCEEILKHYYTGIDLGTVPNKVIRVRLRGSLSAVKLTCASKYIASTSTGARLEIPGGVTAVVTWAGGAYKVTAGALVKTFGAPVTFTPSAGLLTTVTPDDWGKTGKYRGVIRVVHGSAGFTMIDKLPLESYLAGVVPLEMSASWPAEALKAQACAARAYAQRSRKPGEAFDVYCTTRDQAYGGVRAETKLSNAAVKACAGVVPTYKGAPIAAFYFSTSGGHTESVENVWETAPIPYLKGVDDPYDTYSPLHLWPENPIVHSDAWFQGKLGAYSADSTTGVKGTLRSIYVLKRGTSPRVVKAALIGSKGVTFVSGATLRYLLSLRDTWVRFTSMSLTPGATTVTYAVGTRFNGRIYPALKDGATVTLNWTRGTESGTTTIATTRQTQGLGSGYTAAYSAYTFIVRPKAQTTYFCSWNKARSPKVTLKLAPAVTVNASATTVKAGGALTFTGTTTPLLPGATVWLQTQASGTWSDAVSGVFTADGTWTCKWTAAAGVTAARLRVPATAGLVAGYSPPVALTVTTQWTPAPGSRPERARPGRPPAALP
jgi:SpoIID/LytB domain protein